MHFRSSGRYLALELWVLTSGAAVFRRGGGQGGKGEQEGITPLMLSSGIHWLEDICISPSTSTILIILR